MGDLTTVEKVKLSLKTTKTVDDVILADFVTQASAVIETLAGRRFSPVSGTLTIDSIGEHVVGRRLYLDRDFLSVTNLVNGAYGTVSPDDYFLYPRNSPVKWAIELKEDSNIEWQPKDNGFHQGAIHVELSEGYCTDETRPADITMAATKLAVWLYQNRDNDAATVKLADGSMILPSEAPQLVMTVISRYARLVMAG